jgi:hypothetical protein
MLVTKIIKILLREKLCLLCSVKSFACKRASVGKIPINIQPMHSRHLSPSRLLIVSMEMQECMQ